MEKTIKLRKIFDGFTSDMTVPELFKDVKDLEVKLTFSNCSEQLVNALETSKDSASDILAALTLMGLVIFEKTQNKRNDNLIQYTTDVIKTALSTFMELSKEVSE